MSVTKEQIKDAMSSKTKSLSILILREAYKEAIEALTEVITAKTNDGQKIAESVAKEVIDKYPKEET